MNEEKLFKLYEKFYYHEIDMRERLNSRLQIPLTIIAVLLGFLSFMLRNKCSSIGNSWEIVFWISFSIFAIMVFAAIFFFILSMYSYKHKLLPVATETEAYRASLTEYYKDEENSVELVEKYLKKYLYDYYRDFSSANTKMNDLKAYWLHITNLFLIVSVISSFLTFIPYYFGSLDKSNFAQPIKIVLEKPVIIENTKEKDMNDSQDNQPPQPPPPRDVRGFLDKKINPPLTIKENPLPTIKKNPLPTIKKNPPPTINKK